MHQLLFSSFLCCLSPCQAKGQGVITGRNITLAHGESSWSAGGKCQPDIECWLSIRTRLKPSLNEISQDPKSSRSTLQGHTLRTKQTEKHWKTLPNFKCFSGYTSGTIFEFKLDRAFRGLVLLKWQLCITISADNVCVLWVSVSCLSFLISLSFLQKKYSSIFRC